MEKLSDEKLLEYLMHLEDIYYKNFAKNYSKHNLVENSLKFRIEILREHLGMRGIIWGNTAQDKFGECVNETSSCEDIKNLV